MAGLALTLALLGLALLADPAQAAASRHFTQADQFSAFLLAAQNADGSFGDGSLRDSARAAAALANLAQAVPRPQALCAQATERLAAPLAAAAGGEELQAAAEELHGAAQLLGLLSCDGAVPAAAQASLRRLLATEEASVAQLHHAAAAAALLADRGLAFPLATLESLVERLEERVLPDGSVADEEGGEGSLLAAGRAFQTAALVAERLRLDEETADLVAVLAEHADGLLQAYSELAEGVAYVDRGDSRTAAQVTTELLRGALGLQRAGGFDLDAAFVDELADFFASPAQRLDLERVHYTLAGLHLLAASVQPPPLALVLLAPAVAADDAAAAVQVRVCDLFGGPLGQLRVFALSATAVASGRVAASNQQLELAAASETDYRLPLLRPEAGFYQLELAVRAADGTPLVAGAQRTLKVLARVAVASLRLEVLDSADAEVAQAFQLEAGERLPPGLATNYYYSLAFSFQPQAAGKAVAVRQAVVRLAGPGGEASFPAAAVQGDLRVLVDLRAAAAALRFTSATYAVQLIVADAFVENPLLWELGEVAIEFPPRAGEEAVAHQALPEIVHRFREPERRPLAVVSLAYAGLTAAPWALLLLGVAFVGVDVQTPASFPLAVVFLGAVSATFLLYGWFFLALNMFQTLFYLSGLALVAGVSGNRALKARAERRLAAKQKAD